jgi:hypothetical protein
MSQERAGMGQERVGMSYRPRELAWARAQERACMGQESAGVGQKRLKSLYGPRRELVWAKRKLVCARR